MKWPIKKYSDLSKSRSRDFISNLEQHTLEFNVTVANQTFVLGNYLKEGSLARSIYYNAIGENTYITYISMGRNLKEEFDNPQIYGHKRNENVTEYLITLTSPSTDNIAHCQAGIVPYQVYVLFFGSRIMLSYPLHQDITLAIYVILCII